MSNQPTPNFFASTNTGNSTTNTLFGNIPAPATTNFFNNSATNTTTQNTNANPGLPTTQLTFGNQPAQEAPKPASNFFNNTGTTGSMNIFSSKTDNEKKTEAPSKIKSHRRFNIWYSGSNNCTKHRRF